MGYTITHLDHIIYIVGNTGIMSKEEIGQCLWLICEDKVQAFFLQ